MFTDTTPPLILDCYRDIEHRISEHWWQMQTLMTARDALIPLLAPQDQPSPSDSATEEADRLFGFHPEQVAAAAPVAVEPEPEPAVEQPAAEVEPESDRPTGAWADALHFAVEHYPGKLISELASEMNVPTTEARTLLGQFVRQGIMEVRSGKHYLAGQVEAPKKMGCPVLTDPKQLRASALKVYEAIAAEPVITTRKLAEMFPERHSTYATGVVGRLRKAGFVRTESVRENVYQGRTDTYCYPVVETKPEPVVEAPRLVAVAAPARRGSTAPIKVQRGTPVAGTGNTGVKCSKETRQFVKKMRKLGWTENGFDGNGHVQMLHPATGVRYPVAATPSDSRSLRNAEADMRRAVRLAKDGVTVTRVAA